MNKETYIYLKWNVYIMTREQHQLLQIQRGREVVEVLTQNKCAFFISSSFCTLLFVNSPNETYYIRNFTHLALEIKRGLSYHLRIYNLQSGYKLFKLVFTYQITVLTSSILDTLYLYYKLKSSYLYVTHLYIFFSIFNNCQFLGKNLINFVRILNHIFGIGFMY